METPVPAGIKRNKAVPMMGPLWSSGSSSSTPNPPPASVSSSPPAPSLAQVQPPPAVIPPSSSGSTGPASPSPTPAPPTSTTNWPPPHTQSWTIDPSWASSTIPDEHSPMEWCTTWCYLMDLDYMDMREDYPGFGRRLEHEKEQQATLLEELDRELNAYFDDSEDEIS